jgi:hypothetical protein
MATNSHHLAPEHFGVSVKPAGRDVQRHAVDRLKQQLRIFGFLALFRMKGLVSPSAKVTPSNREFGPGLRNSEEQPAHKLIVPLRIDGRNLLEYCGGDVALRTSLLLLLSETTMVPVSYAMADQDLENNGLIDRAITLAQSIISSDFSEDCAPFVSFKNCLINTYTELHFHYLHLCKLRRKYADETSRLHGQALELLNGKRIKGNREYVDSQIEKKMVSLQDSLKKMMALDYYIEVTQTLAFPLSNLELASIYETAMENRTSLPDLGGYR